MLPPSGTQPDTPSPQHRVEITRPSRTALPAKPSWQQDPSPPGDRSVLYEWAHRAILTLIRSTTPATTLGKARSPLARDPHSHTAVRPPTMKDSKALSTVMTATLSAELEGKVPADLVRAVLDESRRSAHDRGVEPTMAEARQRLERFVRARSSA